MKRKIEYEQVVMNVYSSVDDVIEQFNKKIARKAFATFSSKKDVCVEAEDILTYIDKRSRLIDFKKKVSKVLSRFSEEEKSLFEFKYFDNRVIGGYDTYSRQYFRKQDKALKHFGELLGYIGLKEETFYKLYGDIGCVKLAKAHQELGDKILESDEAVYAKDVL